VKDLKDIISKAQQNLEFETNIISLDSLNEWKFNNKNGNFFHKSNRFFSLQGLKAKNTEFPILVQQEIGILGFLASNFRGILHFLVQLKVEPGNPNGFQLSPTVQATRSNYSQVHGGKLPSFLEFFIPGRETITIRDAYQSEQGLRYYKKRNRNIIVFTNNPPHPGNNHIWMTLGQIKELAREPLLINSCTRSVLSMLPTYIDENHNEIKESYNQDHEVFTFLLDSHDQSIEDSSLIDLNKIENWSLQDGAFKSKQDKSFSIIGVEVSGFSREVNSWTQPLLKETSKGEYGLLIGNVDGEIKIFWKLRNEPGLLKGAELGPSWINRGTQDETMSWGYQQTNKGRTLTKIDLAEEGGRFFQSIFTHTIVWIGDVSHEDFDQEYIPLSIKQTERFISNYAYFTIEARSLWFIMRREWFE